MANKHITNPCYFVGTVDESDHPFWTYPDSNKMTTLCPACNNPVAINKSSRTLRKHNGVSIPPEQRDLIHSFE